MSRHIYYCDICLKDGDDKKILRNILRKDLVKIIEDHLLKTKNKKLKITQNHIYNLLFRQKSVCKILKEILEIVPSERYLPNQHIF